MRRAGEGEREALLRLLRQRLAEREEAAAARVVPPFVLHATRYLEHPARVTVPHLYAATAAGHEYSYGSYSGDWIR